MPSTCIAAYSSDLGGSGGVTWTDRNVLWKCGTTQPRAASVINLGGSDTTGTGYDTSVKYLIPDFLRRDQSLQFARHRHQTAAAGVRSKGANGQRHLEPQAVQHLDA